MDRLKNLLALVMQLVANGVSSAVFTQAVALINAKTNKERVWLALDVCKHLAKATPGELDDQLIALAQRDADFQAWLVKQLDDAVADDEEPKAFASSMAASKAPQALVQRVEAAGFDWTQLLPLFSLVLEVLKNVASKKGE